MLESSVTGGCSSLSWWRVCLSQKCRYIFWIEWCF